MPSQYIENIDSVQYKIGYSLNLIKTFTLMTVCALTLIGCAPLPPSPMAVAIKAGDANKVKELLSQGVSATDVYDVYKDQKFNDRNSPIVMAIKSNNTEIVDIFLKEKVSPNVLFGFAGIEYSLLHIAIAHSEPRIVSLLLKFGANVNFHKTMKIINEPYKLHYRSGEIIAQSETYSGNTTFVRQHELPCDAFRTPLICAVQMGKTETVKILLDAGADINLRSEKFILLNAGASSPLFDLLSRRTYEMMTALEWADKRVNDKQTRKDFAKNLDQAQSILNILTQATKKQ